MVTPKQLLQKELHRGVFANRLNKMIGGPCLGDLCCEVEGSSQQARRLVWETTAGKEEPSTPSIETPSPPSSIKVPSLWNVRCVIERVRASVERMVTWFYARCPETTRHLLLVWGVAVAMHVHTCWGLFVWDDRAAVITNPNVNGKQPMWRILVDDFWGAPLTNSNSHKSYRPLTTLSYRLNFLIDGYEPTGYHVINVLLHATMCALVLVLARATVANESTALLATLLYVVHPVHVESVTPLVGRADLLCGCFYIPALLLYQRSSDEATGHTPVRKRVYLIVLAYMCALLSFLAKEVGLTVFGLFIVQDLYPTSAEILHFTGRRYDRLVAFIAAALGRMRRPLVLVRLSAIVVTVAAVMAVRVWLHGEKTVMHWSILENEITYMDSRLSRALAVAHVHFIYLVKLFAPFRQTYDYGYACIKHVETLTDWRNLLSLSTYALTTAVTALALREERRELIWPMALLLVSFTPASHVFVYVGAVVAERLLYIPSIGFCMLIPSLAHLWVNDQLPSLLPPSLLPHISDKVVAFVKKAWPSSFVMAKADGTSDSDGDDAVTLTVTGQSGAIAAASADSAAGDVITPPAAAASAAPPMVDEGEKGCDSSHHSEEEKKEGRAVTHAAAGYIVEGEEDDDEVEEEEEEEEEEERRRQQGSRVVSRALCSSPMYASPIYGSNSVALRRRRRSRSTGMVGSVSGEVGGGKERGEVGGSEAAAGRGVEKEGEEEEVQRRQAAAATGRRRRRWREEFVQRGAAFWLGLLGLRTVWYSWMWMNEETVFHNAFRTCPRSAKVANNYGIGFLNAEHGRKAIGIFTRALDVFPEYANAHYNKALAHFLLGEHENARMHFILSLKYDTGNDMAYAYLGGSETILAERASSDPNATAEDRKRWLYAAAMHLDTAIAKGVDTAQTYHYRGSVALASEQQQLAVYFFERALAAAGRHRLLYSDDPRMAMVRPFTDDIREAYAYNQIGLAYKGMGMYKEAEQMFLQGLEHEPDMYELIANMGVIFLDTNQLDKAKMWLDRALVMNPTSVDLLNNLGVVEERRGSLHLARRYYMQAVASAPHVHTVVANLARVEKALQGLLH